MPRRRWICRRGLRGEKEYRTEEYLRKKPEKKGEELPADRVP